ncbi:MAG: sensor histidine kinase [Candidatus Spyradocola sp.]
MRKKGRARTPRRSRTSIRWKTLSVLGVFALVMIGLLWVFQIVLLDDFYVGIKKNSVTHALHNAQNLLISSEDPESALRELALRSDVCISVLEKDGASLYQAHVTPTCIIHNVPVQDLIDYYFANVAKPGELLVDILNRLEITKPEETAAPDSSSSAEPSSAEGSVVPALETTDNIQWHNTKESARFRGTNKVQSMLCMQFLEDAQGREVLLLVNAILTPVSATTQTLRLQLALVTVLLAALAVLLGLYLSNRVSKPIISISREAEKLAKGDFSVHFSASGYLEAARLADTLNYAAAELGKTEELRRELMANISHDLRTPLTMIEGFAEMMRDLPSENTPENAQVIVDEAHYLSALVRDILDLSKLESGVQEMRPEPLNLTETVRQMVQRYGALCQSEGFTIRVEAEEELWVQADALRLQQVLYNLVNNALAYTGPDKLVLVRQVRKDGLARVEVRDTGKGIAPEDLPYIWDRYYKVDKKSHQRALVGTGLGLSIVKKILVAHSANFGVDSGEGGSTFWFELPLCAKP